MAIFQLFAYYLVTIHSVSDSIVKPFCEMRLLPSKTSRRFRGYFNGHCALQARSLITFVTYYVKFKVDKNMKDDNKPGLVC